MGFVDKPHKCDLPLIAHGSVAKVGVWFECDHCKANWKIQARVPLIGNDGFYKLTFIRREGDVVITRSWHEMVDGGGYQG